MIIFYVSARIGLIVLLSTLVHENRTYIGLLHEHVDILHIQNIEYFHNITYTINTVLYICIGYLMVSVLTTSFPAIRE